MRIALITDEFVFGGGLEHIYQICVGMPEVEFGVFGKDGYAVEKFKSLKNVKLFRNGYSKKDILSYSPDLVHIHHFRPLISLFGFKGKMLFTVHGVHSHKFEHSSGVKNWVKKKVRMWFEGFLYGRVNHLLFVSNEDEEFVLKQYQLGCLSTAIYNGMSFPDLNEVKKNAEKVRNSEFENLERKHVLIVARLHFQKGYDVLLKSLARIDKELLSKIHVDIVGDGPEMETCKELSKILDIDSTLTFHGKKSNPLDYMAASDVFLLPSRWEGLPLTLIEALYCNTPIIGANTYGIREVCSLFSENSVIVNIDEHKDLEQALAQVVNEKLSRVVDQELLKERFGLEQMVSRLKVVYQNTL